MFISDVYGQLFLFFLDLDVSLKRMKLFFMFFYGTLVGNRALIKPTSWQKQILLSFILSDVRNVIRISGFNLENVKLLLLLKYYQNNNIIAGLCYDRTKN